MKTIGIFLLSLLLINLSFSKKIHKLFSPDEQLSDDELVSFPIKELNGDCENLLLFESWIKHSLLQNKINIRKLKTAETTIEDAKTLIFKIINIENKMRNNDYDIDSFLMKSNNKRNKISLSKKTRDSKMALSQIKDDFNAILDKLNEIIDLVSSTCQKDVNDLNKLMKSISDLSGNKHTQNIAKCKEIMKLLDNIDDLLEDGEDDINGTIEALKTKKDQTEIYIEVSDCSSRSSDE